jgi:hypothetical protein
MGGSVFGHILAEFIDRALVDDTMGSDCRARKVRKRQCGEAEGVAVGDVGRIEGSEDIDALLGALVVATCQLGREVEGHICVTVGFKRVGGSMGEGGVATGPERVAAEQGCEGCGRTKLGSGGED